MADLDGNKIVDWRRDRNRFSPSRQADPVRAGR